MHSVYCICNYTSYNNIHNYIAYVFRTQAYICHVIHQMQL